MITSILILAKAVSSSPLKEEAILLVLYLLIPVAASVLYVALKKNRTKNNILRYFIVTATVLVVFDFLLYPYFFDNGSYVNRGMLGVWISALPYVFMIINFLCQTAFNHIGKSKKINGQVTG